MTRIALLGATGSIGHQALDVIERNAELELVAATPVPPLDLTAGPLEFFAPDTETFRLLALAREAGERGGTYPCVFNAANEVAVAAFLDGRVGFLEIAALVEDALGRADGAAAHDLDELREADRRARELVEGAWV
jgi:1-deoxy-D-xylulose-5-phosphate reductoisomerase